MVWVFCLWFCLDLFGLFCWIFCFGLGIFLVWFGGVFVCFCLFRFFFNSESVKIHPQKSIDLWTGQISPSWRNWVKGKYSPGHAEQDPRPVLPLTCLVWSTPSLFALPWFLGGSVWLWEGMPFPTVPRGISLFEGLFSQLVVLCIPCIANKKSRTKAKYCVAECNWEKCRWCLNRTPSLKSGSTVPRSSFGLGVISVYSKCKHKWRNRK